RQGADDRINLRTKLQLRQNLDHRSTLSRPNRSWGARKPSSSAMLDLTIEASGRKPWLNQKRAELHPKVYLWASRTPWAAALRQDVDARVKPGHGGDVG